MPPFNFESASQKVEMAENAWNTKNPEQVSLAYTTDTEWRNRSEFTKGRGEVRSGELASFRPSPLPYDTLPCNPKGISRLFF